MMNHGKLEQLRCTFPKLTETNQQYVLGVAEGLKFAQNRPGESPEKRPPLLRDSGQRSGK
jgi:hypothetical protein